MSPGGAAPTGVGATGGTGDRVSRPSPAVARRLPADFLGLVVLALAVVLLAGVGGATVPAGTLQQDNDTAAPTVGNLTKVDDETVRLVIEDDVDVDESTIDETDFQTDFGRISNVTAFENGTDAHVHVELASALNTDELTVYVPAGTRISDETGKRVHAPNGVSRTVGNMDGVAPFLTTFDASPGENGTIDLRLRFDDPVETLEVDVSGPWSTELFLADFSNGSRPNEYVATVEPDVEGDYQIEVDTVTGSHGNTGYPRRPIDVGLDGTPPEAIASVDGQASGGLNYTFDASRSRDENEITNVTWDVGDGTTLRGERVSHRFEPGDHTVTLYATDANGNTGTDEVFVVAGERNESVGPAPGATVRVTGGGESPSAMVEVGDADAGTPVRIPAVTGRSVATSDAFVLRNLTVTPRTNASYRLGVQVDGPATVGGVESTGASAIGGLTVVHDVPDADLEAVTFTVDVERTAIADAGGDPADVGLLRRGEDGWQGLETAVVERSNETVRYRATSPGLSRFALVVGAGEPGSPGTGTGPTDGPSATADGPPNETADDGDGSLFGLAGLLAALPLGLLETVVTYVGGLVVAAFLVLKALALSMGY